MTKDSFLLIENTFSLHTATIQAVFHNEGVQSRHFTYFPGTDKVEGVKILIKAAQKADIANYVLSLSYDYTTCLTKAIILGTGAVASPHQAMVGDLLSLSRHIRSLLKDSFSFWAHPMLVPAILLENHSLRAENFVYLVGTDVLALEHKIGESFPHISDRANAPLQAAHSKNDLHNMTTRMHANMVQILFANRVYNWANQCSNFLLKTHSEIANHELLNKSVPFKVAHRELQEAIEHVASVIVGLGDFSLVLKDRAQSQLDIVYNFVAQYDARISAIIAVSTGRDSTAMKTLAFITAFFLPGSYVAALFSMSMINWQATAAGSSSSKVLSVSSYFWIYWVVAAPLTGIVMIVWRMWWRYEDRAYQSKLHEAERYSRIPRPRTDDYYTNFGYFRRRTSDYRS